MPGFDFSAPSHFGKSVYSCVSPADNYRLKSLLLLLGAGYIRKRTGVKTRIAKAFLQIPYQHSGKLLIKDIVALFPSYNRREIDKFFSNNLTKNIKIHKNIYHELLNAIGYLDNNNHIPCFLSVYRIIEQIALCLPVISIIEKATFEIAFTEYQKLIDGKARSDLSVLKKYSENVLDPTVGGTTITFDFTHTSKPQQNVNVIKRLLPQKDIATIIVTESIDSIEIKNKHMHYPIIGFRNQYFHYLFHETNISHDDLEYPEEFLKVCNLNFINYYSFLYLDLLRSELSIWG